MAINYDDYQQQAPPQGPPNPPGPAPIPPQGYPSYSDTIDVTVDTCQYPMTEELLSQVFTNSGFQVKYLRGGPIPSQPAPGCHPNFAATVTFTYGQAASSAFQQLNNKAVYPNCNYLRMSMRPAGGPAAGAPPQQQQQGYPPQQQQQQGYPPQAPHPPAPQAPMGDGWGGPAPIPPPHAGGGYQQPHMGQDGMFGGPGGMTGGRGGAGMRGGRGGYQISMPGEYPSFVQIAQVSPQVALFKLFALCEVYGTVITIRRQNSDPSMCIVQFSSEPNGREAAHNLQGCPFYGGQLSCKFMPNFVDRHPIENQPDWDPNNPQCTAYDFTNVHHRMSRRFAQEGRNMPRKYRPGPNVFLTNLTDENPDSEVQAALTNLGATPIDYFRRHANSVLVTFASTEVAVEMIVSAHSFKIGSRYVKLSFSGIDPQLARERKAEDNDEEMREAHMERARAADAGGRGYGGRGGSYGGRGAHFSGRGGGSYGGPGAGAGGVPPPSAPNGGAAPPSDSGW